MKHYLPSSILKKHAREQLFGKLGTVIGAFLLHMLFLLPVAMLTNSLAIDTMPKIVIFFVISFWVELYSSVLLAGEDLIYLKVACGQEVGVMDILYGFKSQTSKIIGVRLIPAILLTVSEIPVFFYSRYYNAVMPHADELLELMQSNNIEEIEKISVELFPLSISYLLLLLAYGIFIVAVGMAFSQTLFLLLDYPDKSSMEIVKYGFKMMKGNWLRFLGLMLSFIPWYILGFITCGLSFVFSYPYIRAVYANFYLDLIKNMEK